MEGQFVVLDKEKKVVAIVSDSEVIINDEYQVIFDRKEEYQFIDCGNGVIKVVKEKTPQDVLDQGELYLEKLVEGKLTINQIRAANGLEPIKCAEFDTLYFKKELLNNKF